jgi:OOP family OmpA-OmpF porin
LRAVHFDFNKSNIRSDARPILDEAARMLKERGEVKIVVEGHTDSIGGDAYNMKLSKRRAEAVKRYLVEHRIAASRITSEGFGKRQPVASNATAEGRAQNRRVELHVQ